ncbi:DUF4861 domain-containing protein [Reichenbachiella agarivorans]|uniref:DUF4861 domain-containing protein n=1 Tax=Reichenbachiella agarivorans TaxID=2979464 RepID=A0ABY6CQZ7_9BACT|nr:DUF4861 domain-containing protein [Reichenbachiella agarivorans]UXP32779.1 DUF4861 domain-containing protein [Reichenbachiella agarivorans]
MKRILSMLTVIAVITGCQPDKIGVTVTNTLETVRAEEPLVLSREFVVTKLGVLAEGQKPLLIADGVALQQQLDDLDGDGNWDELAALVSIDSLETKQLELITTSEYPEFTQRTRVYLGVDYERADNFVEKDEEERHVDNIAMVYPMMYQMEGPAWENDKVGFRNYFDSRNGKDIYAKTTTEMSLHLAGTKGQDYHKLDSWGMDVLKVGNSLGAGGVAMSYEDSLIRLGNTASAKYVTVVEGSIRTIFDIRHQGWDTPMGALDVTERITIWAGQYAFHEQIILAGDQKVTWVAGLVNKHAEEMLAGEAGNSHYIATYDVQTENQDKMGMGLILSNDLFASNGETANEGEGVIETYFMKMKAPVSSPSFCFVAAWELSDERFKTEEGFVDYMQDLSSRINEPLTVL